MFGVYKWGSFRKRKFRQHRDYFSYRYFVLFFFIKAMVSIWHFSFKEISVLGDEKSQQDTIRGLKSAEGYIRTMLAKSINLRNTPQITFILDQSIEYGVNMSRLIDEVTKDLHQEETQDEEGAKEEF